MTSRTLVFAGQGEKVTNALILLNHRGRRKRRSQSPQLRNMLNGVENRDGQRHCVAGGNMGEQIPETPKEPKDLTGQRRVIGRWLIIVAVAVAAFLLGFAPEGMRAIRTASQ